MDRSGAYGAAVVEAWVGVAVVFDKFHILQLMNQRLDELRREWVREAEGAMKMVIQGTRYLLLTRAANLEEDQLPKLERALQLNEPPISGLVSEGRVEFALGPKFVCQNESLPDSMG